MPYKWCAVPLCRNTSKRTPEKLFVCVPKNSKKRNMWMQLARRNPTDIKGLSTVFFCEDHFNMENDMVNYMQYKMGYSQRILMKDGVLPCKFYCQPDHRKRILDSGTSQSFFDKRQKISPGHEPIEDCTSNDGNMIEESTEMESKELLQIYIKEENAEPIEMAENSLQMTTVGRSISQPLYKHSTISSSTSPFKNEPYCLKQSKPPLTKIREKLGCDEDKSDSDESIMPNESSVSDCDTNDTETTVDIEKMQCLQNTLNIIENNPLPYIGISKDCYFIIKLINKHTNIAPEYILLCLEKIRLNRTFLELGENFGISLSYASKLFLKNIPLIASVLRQFIVELDKCATKIFSPISLKQNFSNITCVIDCLEIDVQKPSKALHQALTWSDNKKANTVKYLISCTPNGFINYISPGFGGRTSDVSVVENCKFLDRLEQGTCVLADRGFEDMEQVLIQRGMRLVRSPNVVAGAKLSKAEVRQTTSIASLRIHLERVVRRLREFHMLKQHSVVNNNLLTVLDDVIVIVCALINLQDSYKII